jgi:hypothetical protein
MAYIKSVSVRYHNKQDVINLVAYIGDVMKCDSMMAGGNGVIDCQNIWNDPDFLAEQLIFIQDQKQGFQRRVFHIIISFEKGFDTISPEQARKIGNMICGLYPEYQSVFTLHENTRNMHLHLIINNCPIDSSLPFLTYRLSKLDIGEMVNGTVDKMIGRYIPC